MIFDMPNHLSGECISARDVCEMKEQMCFHSNVTLKRCIKEMQIRCASIIRFGANKLGHT